MGKRKPSNKGKPTAPTVSSPVAAGPQFPLVNRFQLALAMDWNITTISLMQAREGLPVEVRGAPGKSTLYSLPKVIAWRIEREIKRRLPDRSDGSGPALDLDTERARLASMHTRRVELALQQMQGTVAPVGEMAAVVTEMFGVVRAGALALPAALAEGLTAVARTGDARAVERELRDAITGMLRELAAWRPPGSPAPKAAA